MATETITTGIHYRIETAAGAWVHVDANYDEEWSTWSAGVSFGAHAEATPEAGLRALAEQARAFADAVLAPGSATRGDTNDAKCAECGYDRTMHHAYGSIDGGGKELGAYLGGRWHLFRAPVGESEDATGGGK